MRHFVFFFGCGAVMLHLYLMWNLYRGFRSRLWPLAVLLPLALFIVVFFFRRRWGGWLMGPATEVAFLWLGFLLIATVFLFARDAAELVALATDRIFGLKIRLLFNGPYTIPLALLLGLIAFGYSLYEANAVRVAHLRVHTAKLPAGMEKIRLVAMTDLHVTDRTPLRKLEDLAALVNDQRPDIVLVVGDWIDSRLAPDGPQARAFSRLEAKYGKYAVFGNHELYNGLDQATEFIIASGFKLLRGEADNEGPLSVAGVDDPQIPGRVGPAETLAQADQDKFVLFLNHRPEAPDRAAKPFDLQISGHTHGGQIWPWSLVVENINNIGQGATAFVRDDGGESLVYVSNGTGYWGPPTRFLTPPEITVVDIVRK